MEEGPIDVVVRPKRQVTLPKELCERLGIEPGDSLELSLEGSSLVAKPKKKVALEALREIRKAFQRSGLTEAELLETGQSVREELVRGRYGTQG